MSLVNYSSDEDEGDEEEEKKQKQEEEDEEMHEALQQRAPTIPYFPSPSGTRSTAMGTRKPQTSLHNSSTASGETSLTLPDASQLLASFGSGRDVNVSSSVFISTKRSELNGSLNGPPKKILKGTLSPSRLIPDTAGGSLMPPQLRGRSNVATEDLDKLFTRRRKSG